MDNQNMFETRPKLLRHYKEYLDGETSSSDKGCIDSGMKEQIKHVKRLGKHNMRLKKIDG